MKSRLAPTATAAALLAFAALTGCESTGIDAVRADPTPALETLSQREDDVNNAMTVTADENWRMFWQDLGRAFLFDRPSRLTPEPSPR